MFFGLMDALVGADLPDLPEAALAHCALIGLLACLCQSCCQTTQEQDKLVFVAEVNTPV